jgi:hypothetical protein
MRGARRAVAGVAVVFMSCSLRDTAVTRIGVTRDRHANNFPGADSGKFSGGAPAGARAGKMSAYRHFASEEEQVSGAAMTGTALTPADRAVRLASYRSFAGQGRTPSCSRRPGTRCGWAHPFSAAPMGFVVGAGGAGAWARSGAQAGRRGAAAARGSRPGRRLLAAAARPTR